MSQIIDNEGELDFSEEIKTSPVYKGIIKGLDALQTAPGSRFTYRIVRSHTHSKLQRLISTNIKGHEIRFMREGFVYSSSLITRHIKPVCANYPAPGRFEKNILRPIQRWLQIDPETQAIRKILYHVTQQAEAQGLISTNEAVMLMYSRWTRRNHTLAVG